MKCPECKTAMKLQPHSAGGEVERRWHCEPCDLDVIKWRKKKTVICCQCGKDSGMTPGDANDSDWMWHESRDKWYCPNCAESNYIDEMENMDTWENTQPDEEEATQ